MKRGNVCSLPPVMENSTRESVLLLLGWEHNVSTHVCEKTSESFDWLINYINQLETRFIIMQPITESFITMLPNRIANASLVYFVNLFVDVTFDDVYKYTHHCDMEVEKGFQGIRAEIYGSEFISNSTSFRFVMECKIISEPLVWEHQSPYYLAPHRGRARYCNAHVCLFVCLCVCVFVRVFAKFQSVISQSFLNRSSWNLTYTLSMGTLWLTNIFRILGQRSRS